MIWMTGMPCVIRMNGMTINEMTINEMTRIT